MYHIVGPEEKQNRGVESVKFRILSYHPDENITETKPLAIEKCRWFFISIIVSTSIVLTREPVVLL